MEMGEYQKALEAYEADLQRHRGRFNGLFGAGLAAKKSNAIAKATGYFQQLVALTQGSETKRPELKIAESFLKMEALNQ